MMKLEGEKVSLNCIAFLYIVGQNGVTADCLRFLKRTNMMNQDHSYPRDLVKC